MKRLIAPLLIVTLGVGAWLMLPRTTGGLMVAPTPVATTTPRWEVVGSSVERFDDDTIILYRMPVSTVSLRFAHSSSVPRSVREWSNDIADELAVINGVYFNEDFAPTGLLISEGRKVSGRRFDPKRSGLLVLAPHFDIRDRLDLKGVVEAAQSYPFLIKNGKTAVEKDSGQLARRSFIGLDNESRLYLGIAAGRPISLYELGRHLAGLDIKWQSVLNLDGGPSTGLSVRTDAHRFDLLSVPVPNVIIVARTNQ